MAPDINISREDFWTDPKTGKIYFSLKNIAYIGEAGLKGIIEDRNKNGDYYSFEDFLNRTEKNEININRRGILNLIFAGAFDKIENISLAKGRLKLVEELAIAYKLKIPTLLQVDEEMWSKNYFWTLKMKEVTELEFVNFLEIVKEIPDYEKMTSYYLSGSRMSEAMGPYGR